LTRPSLKPSVADLAAAMPFQNRARSRCSDWVRAHWSSSRGTADGAAQRIEHAADRFAHKFLRRLKTRFLGSFTHLIGRISALVTL
jgi:ABC-type long-subunit fatty acid transport system fused permease/ATPase subunit